MDRISFNSLQNQTKKQSFWKTYVLLIKKAFSNAPTKERFVILGVIALFVVTILTLIQFALGGFFVRVPEYGGSITEGIVGTPRFINPVLAYTNTDNDMTRLVYSGLMKKSNEGTLIPDIASTYDVSKDGTIYTFLLKEDTTFHDGTIVTAEDVVFTIETIQNPIIKSPESVRWEGVQVTALDTYTVQFELPQPFSNFLENATVGILPKHIWSEIPLEAFGLSPENIKPIGSGPYRIIRFDQDRTDTVTSYTLRSFKEYTDTRPNIRTIKIKFYDDEASLAQALRRNRIDAGGFVRASIAGTFDSKNRYSQTTTPLARVFGVFFQLDHPILKDPQVRKAISLVIDREELINETQFGRGRAITTPFPPTLLTGVTQEAPQFSLTNLDTARELLQSAGWELNEASIFEKNNTELSFELTTGNIADLIESANYIAKSLNEFGIKTTVVSLEMETLQEDVLRDRNYELLFFGQIVTSPTDLYAFWHSSQRNDPGLNISVYANQTVDVILEKMVRTTNETERIGLARQLQQQFISNPPAVFLFVPEYTYITRKRITKIVPDALESPDERFLAIQNWFVREDAVLPLFTK